jgi:mono/diheme cytochrome c family protein
LTTSKVIALSALLTVAGIGWACGSSEGDKNAKPAMTNAAPAANANANTNAAAPVMVAGMAADVQPIFAAKCKMCHGPEAKGSGKAPNLFEVKDKHTAAEWATYLRNTKVFDKDNTMPKIPLTDDEVTKLSEWLAATTGKGGAEAGDDKGGAAKSEKAEKDEHEKGEKDGHK